MKKTFLAALAAFALTLPAAAQTDNYALSLTPSSTVTCGAFEELNGLTSYTLQFFINPDTWTEGAVVLKRGDGLKVTLGTSGRLAFTVGNTSLAATGLSTGQWQQVTLVVDEGAAKLLVDGTQKTSGTLAAIPESSDELTFGGNYTGRIDEVRIWKAALSSDFNYFINTTLNKWVPQRDDLVAYYKMDQNLCPNLVDYCTITATPGHHGTFNDGAQRVLVSDNTKLPYLVNAAYTYNNRFFDRVVSKDQYRLSNEIIILGATSSSDGHVTLMTPNNHGTLAGGASYLEEFEGRTGVLSLDGTGTFTTTKDCLVPVVGSDGTTSQGYCFETWLYIDEWVEGAYIFRKENAAGTQGFSIRLGSEGQIIARCNGNDYVNAGHITTGAWTHLGITTSAATTLNKTYLFIINGTGGRNSYTSTTLSSQTIDYTPSGMDDIVAVIGENFKGKLDETLVWNKALDAALIKGHMTSLPTPGFDISVDPTLLAEASAAYLYDDPDNVGFSTYSEDGWVKIMKSAYDGYTPARFYLSVSSHSGWTTTIADASKRAIFAADLAELSKNYDGVELDMEWAYSTTEYNNYGLLAQAIRSALPEGKPFRISCHASTYGFPTGKMQYVDGFTFQQYGPNNYVHTYGRYTGSYNEFINYGYAKSKILLSWSTTTSGSYDANGSYLNATIKGIKDVDSTKIDLTVERDCQQVGTNYYYYQTPLQVYHRAAYATAQNVAGIFYWDMGNDFPASSYYNCAKWASYGLNANIDPIVTEVNTATAIHSVTTDDATLTDSSAPTYDLKGRRVSNSEKGLVIQNGKKQLRR